MIYRHESKHNLPNQPATTLFFPTPSLKTQTFCRPHLYKRTQGRRRPCSASRWEPAKAWKRWSPYPRPEFWSLTRSGSVKTGGKAASPWHSPPESRRALGSIPWSVWRAGCRWLGWPLSWGRRRHPTGDERTGKWCASNRSIGWWNSTGAARCGRAPSRLQRLRPRLLRDGAKKDGDFLETCFVDKGAVLSLLAFQVFTEKLGIQRGLRLQGRRLTLNNWGSKHLFGVKDLVSVTVRQDYTGNMHRFLSKTSIKHNIESHHNPVRGAAAAVSITKACWWLTLPQHSLWPGGSCKERQNCAAVWQACADSVW